MKKFIFILFFILISPILCLSIYNNQNYQYYPTTADSGFDSDYGDYDGGSWDSGYDSGSSWDDDDDDYYYSSSSYGGSSGGGTGDFRSVVWGLLAILSPCIIVLAIALFFNFFIAKISKKEETEKRIKHLLENEFDLHAGDGKDLEPIQTAYANYVEIQKAWMNRDLSPVKHLLTDEIYNMYQMQIQTLIEDNQINVMSNFEFVCGDIKYIRTKNNIETLKIILCVNCKDYIIDADKNKVIDGDKNAKITYIYELTFLRAKDTNKTISCPTCGANVKKQMSATCPYCGNHLLLTPSNLTMSNKKIKYQFKR